MSFSTKHFNFDKKLWMIGFGSIGRAVLPLILRHISLSPEQITILTKNSDGAAIAKKYNVNYSVDALTQDNYTTKLAELSAGDFLLNLSIDVSSIALIEFCQAKKILYLDTCIEPWKGVYTDANILPHMRSNYFLRESALALKKAKHATTAIITHGANPGLVSHFVKQALLNIAHDNQLPLEIPQTQLAWAQLAHELSIKVIHIAERDTQVTNHPKRKDEFVNTWSVEGFIAEGSQPAELGWGSHERHWPVGANQHEHGCKSAIYLNRPGASTRVRSWAPMAGAFHGFLITHGESISISNYLTIKKDEQTLYRPTVHYAYHPCEDAVLSLHELAGREWQQQKNLRLIFDEIIDGVDELGVLLMGNKKGAYWFGSQLSVHEARTLAPYNNATSLQVAISVLAGVVWAMAFPEQGIVEPDEIDFKFIMNIATPYLGRLIGAYTDWTPLKDRGRLFSEALDHTDPWQFTNVIVA